MDKEKKELIKAIIIGVVGFGFYALVIYAYLFA